MISPFDVFVPVPEGWFLMGSDEGQEDERPVHRVWVDAFELAVYPVTRAQYSAFLVSTAHATPRDWAGGPADGNLPVVGVSWRDAQAYCAWSTAAGHPVRLPTEAEWERAARGGIEGARYPWGDEMPEWIPEGGRGPLAGPWPVTLGPPNAYGVHGITANVHEWCADWHSGGFYSVSPERNPAGPASGARRVSRGGSWRHAVTLSRTAARSKLDPSFRYTDYGFRVARPYVDRIHGIDDGALRWGARSLTVASDDRKPAVGGPVRGVHSLHECTGPAPPRP